MHADCLASQHCADASAALDTGTCFSRHVGTGPKRHAARFPYGRANFVSDRHPCRLELHNKYGCSQRWRLSTRPAKAS